MANHDNYVIQGDTLDTIANNVRTLTDSSDKMSINEMTENLSQANTDVETQADIIAQIKTALEGKAAGSGNANEIITVTSPAVNAAEALEIFKSFMNEDENSCVFTNTKTQFADNECVVYICQKTSAINNSNTVAFGRYRTTGINFQVFPSTAYDCIFSVGDTFEKVVLF